MDSRLVPKKAIRTQLNTGYSLILRDSFETLDVSATEDPSRLSNTQTGNKNQVTKSPFLPILLLTLTFVFATPTYLNASSGCRAIGQSANQVNKQLNIVPDRVGVECQD